MSQILSLAPVSHACSRAPAPVTGWQDGVLKWGMQGEDMIAGWESIIRPSDIIRIIRISKNILTSVVVFVLQRILQRWFWTCLLLHPTLGFWSSLDRFFGTLTSIDPIAGGFPLPKLLEDYCPRLSTQKCLFSGSMFIVLKGMWFDFWDDFQQWKPMFFFPILVCSISMFAVLFFWSFLAAETLASASLGLLRWTQPFGPGALGGPLVDLCNTVCGRVKTYKITWVWVNTYRYIFSGMNIHLPAILVFTRYQGFDPSPHEITIVGE